MCSATHWVTVDTGEQSHPGMRGSDGDRVDLRVLSSESLTLNE